jgi:hypothetical protein
MKITNANRLNHDSAPRMASVPQEFFNQFTVEECQREVWNLLIAYIGQPNNSLQDQISRSNTAFFCSKITLLVTQLDTLCTELQAEVNNSEEQMLAEEQ